MLHHALETTAIDDDGAGTQLLASEAASPGSRSSPPDTPRETLLELSNLPPNSLPRSSFH